MSSQIGYIILLCDNQNSCHILHYSSKKNRRITRSILGGEVCAIAEAFDAAYTLKYDLENILKRKIPLTMFTDSKSLFDVITKYSDTTEKRLQIDLSSIREGYNCQDISHIAFIRRQHNPADSLTKITNNLVLENILKYNFIDHPIEQWIIRST